MPIPRSKLIGACVVIAGALSYLAIAAAQGGWVYCMDVDEFQEQAGPAGRRERLHGTVEAVELDQARASFELRGASASVRVRYDGPIPELLKPGAVVLVEGAVDQAGVFQADTLLTRCASKYQPATKVPR